MYRRLTPEESDIFYGAMTKAVATVSEFRDAFALLNPFYDDTCATSYVDQWARVGIGPTFLNNWTSKQRATVIIHEALHVINEHHARGQRIGANNKMGNVAADFEINSTINTLGPRIDLSTGILPEQDPWNYKPCLTFEQYFQLLSEDVRSGKIKMKDAAHGPSVACDGSCSPDDSGEPCDGSCGGGEPGSDVGSGKDNGGSPCEGAKGSACDKATSERAAAADELGIERSSTTEKTIARNNTITRLEEARKNGRKGGIGTGTGDMTTFIDLALAMLRPPKVPWQDILRPVISSSCEAIKKGRTDHTFQRPNRRRTGSKLIFPGPVDYTPTILMGVDTSGSMTEEDDIALLIEAEQLIRNGGGKAELEIFPVDTEVKGVQTVKSIREVKFVGGGGTDMSVALRFVNELPRKRQPDLFVLATDGFVPWEPYRRALEDSNNGYRHVLLITNHEGFQNVPNYIHDLCVAVIDIAPDK